MVYDACSKPEAWWSTVIKDDNWNRPAQSDQLVEIQSNLFFVKIGEEDKLKWVISKSGKYVSSETWNTIWEKKSPVAWRKLIWFPLAIPKQAFITWLVGRDALTTGDKLLQLGYKGEVKYAFCRLCGLIFIDWSWDQQYTI